MANKSRRRKFAVTGLLPYVIFTVFLLLGKQAMSTEPEAVGTKSTELEAVGTKSTESGAVGTKSTEPEAVGTKSTEPEAVRIKEIVGRIERVRICPGGIILRAKLDTGARNSSLNAPNIEEFEKNGEKWVRFQLTNKLGQESTIERKIVRIAKIKQHGRKSEHRPVIRLGICLGKSCREVEVNLEDRRKFNYPLLIGRSYMKGYLIIDPDLKYTVLPACKDDCKEILKN